MLNRSRSLGWILLGSLTLCTFAKAQEYGYATNFPDTNTATITGYTGTNTEISLPSNINGLTVTAIGDSAFRWKRNLTRVVIPDSVIRIGNEAFGTCDSLTNVVLGTGLTQIGDSAFNECSGLQSIAIPDSVTNIGNKAFGSCRSLTNVVLGTGLTQIKDESFIWCSGLQRIAIPDSATNIGHRAFYDCQSLTNVVLGPDLTRIGVGAFFCCNSLQYVAIPDNVARIGAYSFSGCSRLTNVVLGSGTTGIDKRAFSDCSQLTDIAFPPGVTEIGAGAFGSCGLTNVEISSNVTAIGDGAFHSCTNLTGIAVDEANGFYCSSNGVLYDKLLTRLMQYPAGKAGAFSVPAGITNIAPHAFESCRELPEVTIPDSVVGIGSNAFSRSGLTRVFLPWSIESLGAGVFHSCTNLTRIDVETGNISYSSLDGVLYNWVSTVLIQFPDGKTNQYSIPDGTLEIGEAAFADNAGLLSIFFPDGLTNIGSRAFAGCSGLGSVSLPTGVTHVDSQTFYGCNQLTNVLLAETITDISYAAFMSCTRMAEILLPSSLTNLGSCTFFGCTNLTRISIPDGVTQIDDCAFESCLNLAEVTFGQGVSEISSFAFHQCGNLSRVYFRGSEPDSWYGLGYAKPIVYFLPNASGWPVPPEQWAGYSTAYWLPEVLADGCLGVQDGACTFTVGWTEGQTVVVEAATSPTDTAWTPLATNTLTGDRFLFSDSLAEDHPVRFYRLRSP